MRPCHMLQILSVACINLLYLFVSAASAAQSSNSAPKVSAVDYARAEKFAPYNTTRLVYGTVRPSWLKDDRFWFRNATPEGSEFVLVDAATGKRSTLFEHSKLAAALSSAANASYEAKHLPFEQIELSPDEQESLVSILQTSNDRRSSIEDGLRLESTCQVACVDHSPCRR